MTQIGERRKEGKPSTTAKEERRKERETKNFYYVFHFILFFILVLCVSYFILLSSSEFHVFRNKNTLKCIRDFLIEEKQNKTNLICSV